MGLGRGDESFVDAHMEGDSTTSKPRSAAPSKFDRFCDLFESENVDVKGSSDALSALRNGQLDVIEPAKQCLLLEPSI